MAKRVHPEAKEMNLTKHGKLYTGEKHAKYACELELGAITALLNSDH